MAALQGKVDAAQNVDRDSAERWFGRCSGKA
jgi:hypothetical protein